jgi:hypothetical protein
LPAFEVWLEFLACLRNKDETHGSTLSPFGRRAFAQTGQGDAHVRARRAKCLCPPALAANRRQAPTPNCRWQTCYDSRRTPDQPRWYCKACGADFSVTSGTLFAWHKVPMRSYLMAIAVSCNEVTGKRAYALSSANFRGRAPI